MWYRHGLVGLALLLVLMAWRLFVAYRKYLRLPHAWAVALLLQVAVWLAMLVLLGGFDDLLRRGWIWF
jgi:hypothetical protein